MGGVVSVACQGFLVREACVGVLGMHTEETRIERDTCIPMFIAALFIIARAWKQPKYPSTEK